MSLSFLITPVLWKICPFFFVLIWYLLYSSFILFAEEMSQAKRMKVNVNSTGESTEPSSRYVVISEALAKFLGTGEREMLHSEAYRRVWEYIKINNLEVDG